MLRAGPRGQACFVNRGDRSVAMVRPEGPEGLPRDHAHEGGAACFRRGTRAPARTCEVAGPTRGAATRRTGGESRRAGLRASQPSGRVPNGPDGAPAAGPMGRASRSCSLPSMCRPGTARPSSSAWSGPTACEPLEPLDGRGLGIGGRRRRTGHLALALASRAAPPTVTCVAADLVVEAFGAEPVAVAGGAGVEARSRRAMLAHGPTLPCRRSRRTARA